MDQVVVKSEVQPNEEILLFFVDENGENEQGVVTTIDNIDQVPDNMQHTIFIQEQINDNQENMAITDEWDEASVRRLLVFYIDNKLTFMSGASKQKFLWSIACKTMLIGQTPENCEEKLEELKQQYIQEVVCRARGLDMNWELFEQAEQAFVDDSMVQATIEELNSNQNITVYTENQVNENLEPHQVLVSVDPVKEDDKSTVTVYNEDGSVRRVSLGRAADEKVVKMLEIYLRLKNTLKLIKKDCWQRGLWETIALEMGETDAEYWNKRFQNLRHNYIRLLDKRNELGPDSINWPYMEHFDKIYENDIEFQKKFSKPVPNFIEQNNANTVNKLEIEYTENDWIDVEVIVLAKYCYDTFDEFQDPTIPDDFLWMEVGHLVAKKPETCKSKIEELITIHLQKYIAGGYNLFSRSALEILLDNLIYKETEKLLFKSSWRSERFAEWMDLDVDKMIDILHQNAEPFKDSVCYLVCFAAVGKDLQKSVENCRKKWEKLVLYYRSLLDNQAEDPEAVINWKYMNIFNGLFDHGRNEKLLLGYDFRKIEETKPVAEKKPPVSDDDEDYTDKYTKGGKTLRNVGKSKGFKILNYYIKNKDKFNNSKKLSFWQSLAKQIGMTASQCAHRFRNLKQVYTGYVEREIMKPEMPIVWPYYQLCKKAFGYTSIKNKIYTSKSDSERHPWTTDEIESLISYFAQHFDVLNDNTQDKSKWSELSQAIGQSENACHDKFIELRKSYRKLKTMKTRNQSVKVTWKYFDAFDQIFSSAEHVNGNMDINDYEVMQVDEDIEKGLEEDDDIQCIIVIPEGQNDVSNARVVLKSKSDIKQEMLTRKWTKKTKKMLLKAYLEYLKLHCGDKIDAVEMWKEVASKLPNKTSFGCRKMFRKLKEIMQNNNTEEVNKIKDLIPILDEIIAIKPKFKRRELNNEEKTFKDVEMSSEKVAKTLQFYNENLEEFVSHLYEKKYAWTDLAKHIDEPISNVFNKVNYLKSNFDKMATDDPNYNILKEILDKEVVIRESKEVNVSFNEQDEDIWSEDEVEQLLVWYLANLDKFKNPKFVRKYLWLEVSKTLAKKPLSCSKKMSEIRSQYRNMVKETPNELESWRFYELCQKIYGTGKQRSLEQDHEIGIKSI